MITGITMVCLAYAIETSSEKNTLFFTGLTLAIFSSAIAGYNISKEEGLKTSYIITPKVHVVCENGKCDTTYIYRFKTK